MTQETMSKINGQWPQRDTLRDPYNVAMIYTISTEFKKDLCHRIQKAPF